MKSVYRIKVNALILGLFVVGIAIVQGPRKSSTIHESNFVSQAPAVKMKVQAQVKTVATEAPAFAKLEANLQQYMKLEEAQPHQPAKVSREREKLLKNASLLRSLRGFLSRPALDAREAAEQNAGFALLLEAAHGEQAEVATETLRMVVADEEMDDILTEASGPRHALAAESDETAGLTPRALSEKLWQSALSDPELRREESAAIAH